MQKSKISFAATFALSSLGVLSLSSCGRSPASHAPVVRAPEVVSLEVMPASPLTQLGVASGRGTVERTTFFDSKKLPEKHDIDFLPTFSYVYPETRGSEPTLWIVLTDHALNTASIDEADDRSEVLRAWCEHEHANLLMLHIDSHGTPLRRQTCPGDGRMVGNDGEVNSQHAKVDFKVNDGKRAEGTLAVGEGTMRVGDVESWVKTTGQFSFATDLAPYGLRDRVKASGDDHASGVPGAQSAFSKYWSAAGAATQLSDLDPWVTPERREHIRAQSDVLAASGGSIAMLLATFAEPHKEAMKITGAKAIGAAAVITSEIASEHGLNCETLLLQLDGAWRVGNEDCRR